MVAERFGLEMEQKMVSGEDFAATIKKAEDFVNKERWVWMKHEVVVGQGDGDKLRPFLVILLGREKVGGVQRLGN